MAQHPRRRAGPLPLPLLPLLLAVSLCASAARAAQAGSSYYGKFIGKLKTLHHGVSGDVYAVDARTLHIRDFNYDGEGPAAYFYAGDSKSPSANGFRINDEKGTPNVLPRYRNKHITLTLPENKTLRDIRWFSVWCDEFSVNFGDVRISKTFEYPRPQKIDALSGVHAVSSDNIVVVDAQTLLIPSFNYDGEAPDAKFWVGRGAKPSPQGVRVPDENGKEVPLRRYDRKTIVLTLPGDLTVYDIGHFGVWCEAFTVDFGHVRIPRSLNVPPSLKMLGVSPQSKLNCEVLWDENAFEVRWAVAGDSVVIQLVGKIDDGEYMSFGLSGDDSRSRMVGGDVAVVWVNHSSLAGDARDYFLDAKSQCAGTRGSCPDQRLREGTNSIRLLNAAMVNGYSIVTYQRPLHGKDELDRPILTNGSQAVIWALGPLNSRNEVSYHRIANRHDVFIDFARSPKWNCPIPESDGGGTTTAPGEHASSSAAPATVAPAASTTRGRGSSRPADTASSAETLPQPSRQSPASTRRPGRPSSRAPATPAPAPTAGAWDIPAIQCYEPEDGVFYAQMGPTGGKRGYSAITGHVGWGISWYINGLLIPEINVVRGKTYTFVVEGGNDPETPARYHPFYITDDPVGGYAYKTPEERSQVQVFAGLRLSRGGEAVPTGTGRLCNWTPDPEQPHADEFASFGAYQRTLTLECDPGEAGVVQWTPNDHTPDTVYYQCFTHRYLGWRINVLDSCDAASAAGSEPAAARAPVDQATAASGDAADSDHADADADEDEEGELQSRPSIRVTTRVRPDGGGAVSFFSGDKDTGIFKDFRPTTISSVFADGAPGDLFISPAALQQEPPAPPQPQAQFGVPDNTFEDTTEAFDAKFTLQPTTEAVQQTLLPEIRYNDTAGADYGLRPSPVDLAYTESPAASESTLPSSVRPVVTDFGSAGALRMAPTTPRTLMPPANKTTDVKLVSSTAMPSVSPVYYRVRPNASEIAADGAKATSEPAATIAKPPAFMFKRPGMTSRPPGLAPHTFILPAGGRPTHMLVHRPQGYALPPHYRRPLAPHRGYAALHRPAATALRPTYIPTPLPAANYIMTTKKPYYRVTMLALPHRTMMSPTPYHRQLSTVAARPIVPVQPLYSSAYNNIHYALPPQRIKYDKHQVLTATTPIVPMIKPVDASNEVRPAESVNGKPFISPAPLLSTTTETANVPLAVNTGFKPESVVVEGGFKPIINKNIAQDRSSIETDPELLEQVEVDMRMIEKLEKEILDELVSERQADDRKDNPFEGQRPESFEPMFIPSPPDRVNQQNSSNSEISSDHSGDLNPSPQLQVYRNAPPRRPLYPNNAVTPLTIPLRAVSPSFRYQQSAESLGEMAMAAERMDTYYLPPTTYAGNAKAKDSTDKVNPDAGTIPPGTVLAYDGKSVVDVSLASSISDPSAGTSSVYNPKGTADLIRRTPQFGPFQGEIPPPIPKVVHPESIPQLQNRNQHQTASIPQQFPQSMVPQNSAPNTKLSIVQNTPNDKDLDSSASQVKELVSVYESKYKGGPAMYKEYVRKSQLSNEHKDDVYVTTEEEPTTNSLLLSTEPLTIQDTKATNQNAETTPGKEMNKYFSRVKRDAAAHHEPGHTGSHDDESNNNDHNYEHDHHEHNHDHVQNEPSQRKQQEPRDQMHHTPSDKSKNNAEYLVPSLTVLCLPLIIHIAKHFS